MIVGYVLLIVGVALALLAALEATRPPSGLDSLNIHPPTGTDAPLPPPDIED